MLRKKYLVRYLSEMAHIPVDTGRKLNVHKTFNLRPVSTGMGHETFKQNIFRFNYLINRIQKKN